jgi:PIN domain nuclease of toxin-antitoxin system
MNHLLVDSHILLWAVTNAPDLNKAAARLIETTPLVYVSILSLFELKLKAATASLKLPTEFEHAVKQEGFTILDLTPKQLHNYRIFFQPNADPFDNALLTIAESQHFGFLTADNNILALKKSYSWITDGS